METLDPESKCETTPRSDSISRTLPEEDSDTAPRKTGDGAGEDEHTAQGATGGVDRG